MDTGLYQSPLGSIMIIADGEAIKGLWMEGQSGRPDDNTADTPSTTAIKNACAWLDMYFNGSHPSTAGLNLSPSGTEFQKIVWKHLLMIPYGQTVTYGDIAKAIANVKGKTIVGGGDSISAIHKLGKQEKIYHISTGGGASLKLLEGELLPGVEVIEDM